MIVQEVRLLAMAAAFLTRLPLARRLRHSDEDLNHSSRYFSLVGAGVGAMGALVLACAAAWLPLPVAVILSVVATVLLTGAFHEDGLADTCDAFGGGMTREDIFRIMEDSRIGAFGALGLGLAIALKATSLACLPLALATMALVFAHAFSRSVSVLVMALGQYAKKTGGKTRPVAAGVGTVDAAIATAIGLAPVLLAPALFLPSAVCMLLAGAGMYAYFRARVGGYTGDTLGAIQQVSEIVCYLVLLAQLP